MRNSKIIRNPRSRNHAMKMIHPLRIGVLWISLIVVTTAAVQNATAQAGKAESADAKLAEAAPLDQAALERKFEETMSGATLVGTFTLTGQTDKKLHEEKYTIESVKKIKGE